MSKPMFLVARDHHDFKINKAAILAHKEYEGARPVYVGNPEVLRGAALHQRNVVFCEDWELRDNAREIVEALMLRIEIHPDLRGKVGL